MSNKNGEDTLRRQRHNAAIRILEDEDEEYKLNCICTLLESQQELASLREQLKQQEEVIRELKSFIDKHASHYWNNETLKEYQSLTTKDK